MLALDFFCDPVDSLTHVNQCRADGVEPFLVAGVPGILDRSMNLDELLFYFRDKCHG